jgi:hypothetical protein
MKSEPSEAGAPQTVLFAMIKERAGRVPFAPFRVVTTSGRAYDVPTSDHIGLLPKLRTITIIRDDDGTIDIHTLHVSAVESLRRLRRKRAA